jgi:PEP-CTERM motif
LTGTLDFYNVSDAGGFDLFPGADLLINAFGPQLYTGTEDAPTFLTGTFSLTDYASVDGQAFGGTLNVTSVPEPSTLSLLAVGVAIGLASFLFRKN